MHELRFLLLAVLGSLVIFVGFTACAGREGPGGNPHVLHLANGAEPADLDPQTVTGRPESMVIRTLIQGLVSYDPQTLAPIPGQAERWDISEDGKTYTFYLREDALWSNGDRVTAQDFVGSWQRMLTASLASEYAYQLYLVEGAEDYHKGESADFSTVGFTVIDDRTIRVQLRNPTSYFMSLLLHNSWHPVHLATVEQFGGLERKGTRWTRPENYVGNGPFVLKEWVPNQHILVEPSPTYWDREMVQLEGVRFYPIENTDTEERMFRTGQLDVTQSLPLSKLDEYRANRPDVFQADDYLAVAYYRVNVTRPQLSDPQVRRALALAVDRVGLTEEVLRGTKTPAWNFTPAMPGFMPPRTFEDNVEKAQTLLAEAGYPNGEGLPAIEILYPTSDMGRVICEALQAMWTKNLNIDVQLYNQEWKVYLDSLQSLDYEVTWSGWIGDYVDPMSFLDMMVTAGGNNRTGWSSARYDALLAQVQTVSDPVGRMELFYEMERLIGEACPVIPLYFYTNTYLLNPEVKGWHPTLLDIHPLQYVSLERTE